MRKFIDLSHKLEPGMPVYPGLPEPDFTPFLRHEDSGPRYEGKAEFELGMWKAPTNLGTYLDSAFHRYRDGKDLSRIPLESVAGLPGVVLDAEPHGAIDVQLNEAVQGKAVLIRTGWDQQWGSKAYFEEGPFLSDKTVDGLVKSKPALIGVDFSNIDDVKALARPAHTKILGAEILVVEHLTNLAVLPTSGFRFFAIPPRLVGGASFTVRAFAEID